MISANLLIFSLTSLALIVGVELIKRKFSIPIFITRKVAHIGGSLIAFTSPYFLSQKEVIFVALALAVILSLTRGTTLFSSIQGVKRNTLGEVYLPISVALCAIFFLPNSVLAFQFGMLVMGISDGLAGLVGEGLGKKYLKVFGHRKSVEGSSAFFFSTLILTVLFAHQFNYRVIGIVVALTVIELSLEFGLDNLVLPLFGAFLMSLVL